MNVDNLTIELVDEILMDIDPDWKTRNSGMTIDLEGTLDFYGVDIAEIPEAA